MERNKLKTKQRKRRKVGIRKRIQGTPERPRLTVFRSSKNTYAQVVDDLAEKTIVAAGTVQEKVSGGGNVAAAKVVGKTVAERALAAGIRQVAFDRNGYKYHGRVKALADAAREAGLKF